MIRLYFLCLLIVLEAAQYGTGIDLTLTATPEGGVIGDKLILTCGIMLTTTENAIDCNLKIFDSSEVQLAETDEQINREETKIIQVNVSSFELFEPGYQTVSCQGYFETKYGKMVGRLAKFTNATIRTYNFPTNLNPDKTEVTVGGTVICQPFADPPAKHVWSCLGGEWSSSGARLTLKALGKLNCSCSVIGVYFGVSHEITWSGFIRVIGGW